MLMAPLSQQQDVMFHASSSSTSTPSQSLGWRNMTGLPWAPIRGSAESILMFLVFRSAIAALMSSTCSHRRNKTLLFNSLVIIRVKNDHNWVSTLITLQTNAQAPRAESHNLGQAVTGFIGPTTTLTFVVWHEHITLTTNSTTLTQALDNYS